MRSARISDVSRFGKRKPETARVTFGIPTPFPRRLFGTVSRRGRNNKRGFGEGSPLTPPLFPSLPLARDLRLLAHRRAAQPKGLDRAPGPSPRSRSRSARLLARRLRCARPPAARACSLGYFGRLLAPRNEARE